MRVTPEMVAAAAYAHRNGRTSDFVREMLEAALADVPERDDVEAELDRWVGLCRGQEERAEVAEAKLEKVRAWRADFCAGRVDDFADLDEAILDEEP